MNFKNVDKPYLIIMFIFCLLNPIYCIGLLFGYLLINSEEKIYKKFSKEKKVYCKQNRTIFDDWPTQGVSKKVELENKIHNQSMKLMRTNSFKDLEYLVKLENDLENYYRSIKTND